MNSDPRQKQKARRYALQALYGWVLSANDLADIEKQYLQIHQNSIYDHEYFKKLLYNIPNCIEELESFIAKHSLRLVSDLDPIEKVILWIGLYELKYSLEVPFKVVVNEAIELSKMFGATDSHRFINSVLDKSAGALRTL